MKTPPNPQTFNAAVWLIVRQVPHGIVSTYGQVAAIIPPPDETPPADYQRFGPIWVGKALNTISFNENQRRETGPPPPWWRIVNSKGGISLPAGSDVAQKQKTRLLAEDILFDGRGQIDLVRFGWAGPPQSWLDEHQLLKPFSFRATDGPTQLSLF